LGLACSCLFEIFLFLIYVFMAINFILRIALLYPIDSNRFCFHFH
jgi:hypothetical protein